MTGHDRGSVLTDAFRLSVGTLSALPVPPPHRIDARRARLAIAVAPMVGLLPGAAAGAAAALAAVAGLSPMVAAVLAVSAAVLSTRGMHLDGLADTADALAASYDRERALRVMRSGDTGPAGVTAVVLVLVVQVGALAQALDGLGPLAAVIGVAVGRLPVVAACVRGVPAARREGLGATFAGRVPRSVLAVSVLGTTLGVAGLLMLRTAWIAAVLPAVLAPVPAGPSPVGAVLTAIVAVTATVFVAVVVIARAVARFGGITGDVLGALVETGTATALLVLAMSVG
jgi:adenosylcobinamide-GDP ribazoletransferase